MLYTELTKKALKMAYEAHKNQVDKSGLPYIYHPFHLAEQMETEDEICVALLHGVIEDTDTTLEQIKKMGFNQDIIYALSLMTHDDSMSYMDYIKRIKRCSDLAKKVKLADLEHNSDLSRLDSVSEKDKIRVEKYNNAKLMLSLDNSRIYGAVIGDIVGSKYEFDNIKTKEFPFLSAGCNYTDDTIMTIAVTKAILRIKHSDFSGFYDFLIEEMQELGRKYPHPQGGYGGNFGQWIFSDNPKPYNSYGNGSAMRVSPCAIYAVELDEALKLAEISASVTHNHPEGIKGAQATVAAIFLAKTGKSKDEIRKYISENFYSLNETVEEIRENYNFNETCQGTVPQAITAFLESESFEDAIRTAVSLGGDSDTLAAITGSIAWVYYSKYDGNGKFEIPLDLAWVEITNSILPSEFIETMNEFERRSAARQGWYNRITDSYFNIQSN